MKRLVVFIACVAAAVGVHVGALFGLGIWQAREPDAPPPEPVAEAEVPEEPVETPEVAEVQGVDENLGELLALWDREPGSADEPEIADLDDVDQERPDAADALNAAPEAGPPPEQGADPDTEVEAVPEEWDLPSRVRVASGVAPELSGPEPSVAALSAPSFTAPTLAGAGSLDGARAGLGGDSAVALGGGIGGDAGPSIGGGGALALAPRAEEDPYVPPPP
ncbi:MAG: hypothetical protein AAGE83_07835, partial [Pseudomonadota bacterium]